MKRYSTTDFDKLNLQQRQQLVFKTGNYVTKRRKLHYIFALYTVGKEFFEVRYNDLKHTIEQIEKPKDKQLFIYTKEVYLEGLSL